MAKKTCWYCGDPATEVWRIEGEDHRWPMCEKHSAAVRDGIALRAAGESEKADEHDQRIGIDTEDDGWVDPCEARLILRKAAAKVFEAA